MNELNDENLLRIFGFLEVGDLSSARQTCKRWCHVTDDYTLWRSLCYSLRLSDRRVFKFSRRSSSSSPHSPSSPESEPAPSALSKLAFKLEKFDLEPLASNWKVLYRRLRTQSHFVGHEWLHRPDPRLHCSISGAISAAKRGDYIYIMPGTYYCDGHGLELEAPIRLAEDVVLVGLGDTAADVVLQAHKKSATRPAFIVSEVDDIEGISGFEWTLFEVYGGQGTDEVQGNGADDGPPRQVIKDITFVGSNNHAICVGDGSNVVLENCRFTNSFDAADFSSATAVNIFGTDTNTTLKNCCIYQSKKHGVFVGEGAKATLINVDIDGAEHSGVHVKGRGDG
ncbi:Fbox domain containing protein [Acanthamoeba castellanii str. Neff]|uniref:Fbox domain containing protein n=1 Tax=Acanthamoeba castellanii (strain ATCC 30010 / Neff) TaxID=1257118 RepID=L8HAJ8_ACACF|nr:Fbox domain containing protein [Acanthamoeba castellanii str. Neff]ELR22210.1 Fbox domain containing protein [Acanthamoeba castellanii str. Neff]